MQKTKYCLCLVLIFVIIMISGCKNISNTDGTEMSEQTVETSEQTTSVTTTVTEKTTETRVTETEPVTIKETEPEIKEDIRTISILGVGDVMSHDQNIKSAYDSKTGEYSYKEVFKYVKPVIESVDFAIANLETVTAGEEAKGYTGYPSFNTPASILDALKYAGFDMIVTANNHSIDRGKTGIIKTIDELDKRDMLHTGTYKSPESRVTYTEVNGFKIAIMAYTYGCNGNLPRLSKEEQKYMVNILSENRIKEDIKKAKSDKADIVIVYLHWGVEYMREPQKSQEKMAMNLFECGADIIFGTHPHVVQKSEVINIDGRNRYIIYSMGNYYSNFRRSSKFKSYTEDGVMPIINYEKDFAKEGSTAELKSVTHIPTWVDKYYKNSKLVYHILPIDDLNFDESFAESRIKNYLKASYGNTTELVNDFSATE
jgi:hypothetical protein